VSNSPFATADFQCRVATLVFTDLEASTERKRLLGDRAAAQLIARHQHLVRGLLAAHGGEEIDNAGDGFFLVFAVPSAAVRFALELQTAHAAQADLPKVRVGVHLGEVCTSPTPAGASKRMNVTGLSVDVAARIQSLAWPGQVLVSDVVHRNARQQLGAGARETWREYGAYAFKGLDHLLHDIVEVGLEGLSPLRAPADGEKARRAEAIGPYRLLRKLGEGGRGIIYQATTARGEICALKILHPRLAADPVQAALFRRQIAFSVALRHPRIVKTHAGGESDGHLWLAGDYLPGGSLEDLLATSGALDAETTWGVLIDTLEALVALEATLLVHRDLKPAALLRGGDGRWLVSDFGRARSVLPIGVARTAEGNQALSPYLAPERRFDDTGADIRGDLYALGAIVQRCLGAAPGGAAVPPGLGPAAARLVATLLSADPQQRPACAAAALEQALAAAQGGVAPVGTSAPTMPEPDPLSGRGTISAGATLGQRSYSVRAVGRPGLGRAKLVVIPDDPSASLALEIIFVYAATSLVLGRKNLDHPGQDVCLRLRPAEAHKDANLRISGQHLRLASSADGASATALAGLLTVDDRSVETGRTSTLPLIARLRVAQVLDLTARQIAWSGAAPLLGGQPCDVRAPALWVSRPTNGSDQSYLLVPGAVALSCAPGGALVAGEGGGLVLMQRDGVLHLAGEGQPTGLAVPLHDGLALRLPRARLQVSALSAEDQK
jgi:class 3 adenylate cyclase